MCAVYMHCVCACVLFALCVCLYLSLVYLWYREGPAAMLPLPPNYALLLPGSKYSDAAHDADTTAETVADITADITADAVGLEQRVKSLFFRK